MSKRKFESFFTPITKKPRPDTAAEPQVTDSAEPTDRVLSSHTSYPWPIPFLPTKIQEELELQVTAVGKSINSQPHLDLLYFQPFIPANVERDLFNFLRSELFFYRVKYTINRFGKETLINTPRYTTVFGIDETSRFAEEGKRVVEGRDSTETVRRDKYRCVPRPIPECLDLLRRVTEANTDTRYNFCLVNYYASGKDSITFHSDDERFLGPDPAIASFSLGAKRDFLLKHKPSKPGDPEIKADTLKYPLSSGDMILMRGQTQSNWLHSIPKRKGAEADRGRINITFRRAMIPAGTENYYRYNVGDGQAYRWNKDRKAMLPWTKPV